MNTRETTPPRFVIGAGDARALKQKLLPDKLSCAPSSVKVANATAIAAVNAAITADGQMRAAQEEAKRAVSIDASADREAVAAGRELPPENARVKATEALHTCARRNTAAQAEARDSVTLLMRAISKHRVTWMDEQRSTIEAIEADAREQVAALTQTLSDLEKERHVLRGLETFPVQGSLHGVQFAALVQETNPALIAVREVIDPVQRDPVRNSAPTSRRTLGEK
jgi:hypothetical protein